MPREMKKPSLDRTDVFLSFLAGKNISEDNPYIASDTELAKEIGVQRTTVSAYKRMYALAGVINFEVVQLQGHRRATKYTYFDADGAKELEVGNGHQGN